MCPVTPVTRTLIGDDIVLRSLLVGVAPRAIEVAFHLCLGSLLIARADEFDQVSVILKVRGHVPLSVGVVPIPARRVPDRERLQSIAGRCPADAQQQLRNILTCTSSVLAATPSFIIVKQKRAWIPQPYPLSCLMLPECDLTLPGLWRQIGA